MTLHRNDRRLVKLTKAQRHAVYRIYCRDPMPVSYREFRATVIPAIGLDCVVVRWAGMWVAIESDGYAHT